MTVIIFKFSYFDVARFDNSRFQNLVISRLNFFKVL